MYLKMTLTVGVLFLLMMGYIGVNLLEFTQEAILAFRLCAGLLILLMLVLDRTTLDVNIFYIMAFAISGFGVVGSSISLNILFVCLYVLATRSISFEFMANSAMIILGAVILGTLLFLYYGVTENIEDIGGFAGDNAEEFRVRMTFGYKNVNAFASVVSGFCFLLMLSRKLTVIKYIASMSISYIFYLYTDSRSMLIGTFSFIVFILLFNIMKRHNRILYMISWIVIGVPAFMTVTATILANQFPLLDSALSWRLTFVSDYFNEMPAYSLLIGGSEPSKSVTVDNAFGLFIGAMGIPFFLYFIKRITVVVRSNIDQCEFGLCAFILSFWLFSFSESSLVRPETLVGILFWVVIVKHKSSLAHSNDR